MSLIERMLGEQTGESEEARLAREAGEKAATEKAKRAAAVREKERFSQGVRLSGASDEEVKAGLERAVKGAEKKLQYSNRPSDPMDKEKIAA